MLLVNKNDIKPGFYVTEYYNAIENLEKPNRFFQDTLYFSKFTSLLPRLAQVPLTDGPILCYTETNEK